MILEPWCMEPRLIMAVFASVVNPAVLIYMWHFVPWLLPFEFKTLLNTKIGGSNSLMFEHENMSRPVCDFGRAVSYLYLAYCIARLVAILVLGKKLQKQSKRAVAMRAAGWAIYGAMLTGAYMMNVRAFILMLITIPLEVVMDWVISGEWKESAISSSIALGGSICIGTVGSLITGIGMQVAENRYMRDRPKYTPSPATYDSYARQVFDPKQAYKTLPTYIKTRLDGIRFHHPHLYENALRNAWHEQTHRG